MKTVGVFLTVFGLVFVVLNIIFGTISSYKYEKSFNSYWELADKSSTVIKKSEYIDKFVNALEKSGFVGKNDAIFQTTLNNSFDKNLEALKSLQTRLQEMKKMDTNSQEYQFAMQQITGQEQGEASDMLKVFSGIWYKENYILLWGWIATIQIFVCVGLIAVGLYIIGLENEWFY